MHTTLYHTTMMMIILTLLLPLVIQRLSTPTTIAHSLKVAFMQSLVPLMLFINTGMKSTTTNLRWVQTNLDIQASLLFDIYTTIFLPVALFITWAILEFTMWYMSADPHLPRFTKYLLLFLIAMITLTTANNMLQLFIGWEGVGIMSFLLINWWGARTNANTAALQAVIFNRIGDIGLILSMAWLAMNYNTWEIQQMFTHSPPLVPLVGLIIAAMGKSAQFGLHPWLPAAMEGPTPVSALLHSSTMVVAGIFLLIRMHPMMAHNKTALTLCLCLGAMTTTFAALCALTQNDIKKIIAFSTSSQLGLMMLTLGMNQPKLAFLHIITHAFFKALLFLCAGSIIHNLSDEQDLRKMGGTQTMMPVTSTCLTLGSLALIGTPFLAGFYTKDTIIECLNTSTLNAWALLTTALATALTAAYSTRLIFYTHLSSPRNQTTTTNEAPTNQTQPLLRLAVGSITTGLLVLSMTAPDKPHTLTMPMTTKLAALAVTTLGLMLALDLTQHTTSLTTNKTPLHATAQTQLYFFTILMHRHAPLNQMKIAQEKSLQLNDSLWYEMAAPLLATTTSTKMSTTLAKMLTGSLKTHLMTFTALISLTVACTCLFGSR
uniref:NADH-ubiquinone oxidoreductase chain 5 n=1 Tax=Hemidactylus bowringii TaxID=146913 RepID=A0A0A7E7E3_9SAUR|nr:NADH dehydrogenase subunit 5 [Hemidactylus bowringii]AIY61208.1 NADH dehydrogenase subunit 5 [Hemidactylus bowringii]